MKIISTNWGKAGSGILFVCPDDKTAMLLFRSGSVMDPHMWGIPGGAVKGTEGYHEDSGNERFDRETLWNSAVSEANEEVFGHSDSQDYGYGDEEQEQLDGMAQATPHEHIVVYDTNPRDPSSFKYYTFLVEVPLAEKKRMMLAPRNWESTDMKWFPIDQLRGHVKPLPAQSRQHPEHPQFGKVHNGVAHVLNKHPYFNQQKAPTARKPHRKPEGPNQQMLF